MSIRLYVGNLPEDLSRQDLEAAFADAGEGVSAKLITDRKTGKCRGFGFVTVKSDELADQFIEKYNGVSIKDNAIKIEKALPRSKDKADEPAAAPVASAGGKRKGGNTNNNNKSRRTTTSTADPDSVQPDPRWAQELEKLKQMLATQTTNS
ncbi:RNA-binding protein [Cyanobacteria bacterium FACHB-DQ100]|uniref:RNA recognition motif domain-containing protein n=1 Tax=unclassified Leptolyngbya TaxID=2650499 RepID=UPI00168083FB|nr:RNA-binding protein [Leptolyngbya sp. FACHB-17]MBD1825767.1 RNA-binding protein [Cyanobacteria bacterium FACHB-DQ100]MBD2078575.1 RNA-binding protein [Leptolyngbya sp. FACHB-17]